MKNLAATTTSSNITPDKQLPLFWHIIIIFIVAAILRWGYLAGFVLELNPTIHSIQTTTPISAFMFGDAEAYYSAAVKLLDTHSLGVPYTPPLTTIALAGALSIGSTSYLTAHIWQLFLGCLIPVLFTLLTFRWFNRRIAILTGWFIAAAFPMLILSGTLASETLLLVLMAAALLCLESKHPAASAGAGILLGLALLTRAESILFIGVLIVWHLFLKKSPCFKFRILMPVLILCTVFPWSLRNYLLMNEKYPSWPTSEKIIPISANGPLNFYLGNGPMASGGYRSFQSGTGRQADTLNFNDPIQRIAFFNGYYGALDYLSRNPDRIKTLLSNKIRFFSRGLRPGFGPANIPWGFRGYQHRGDMWGPDNRVSMVLLPLLWIIGLIVSRERKTRAIWLSICFCLTGTISALLFFGLARNATMLLPFMFMGKSALIDAMISRRFFRFSPQAMHRIMSIHLIVIVLLITGRSIWMSIEPRHIETSNKVLAELNIDGGKGFTRQDFIKEYERVLHELETRQQVIIYDEAVSSFIIGLAYNVNGDDPPRVERLIDQALFMDPSNAEAWKLRGVQAMKEPDKFIEALRAFQRYLEIDPRAPDAEQIHDYIARCKSGF